VEGESEVLAAGSSARHSGGLASTSFVPTGAEAESEFRAAASSGEETFAGAESFEEFSAEFGAGGTIFGGCV
jgi:hypothetical protein